MVIFLIQLAKFTLICRTQNIISGSIIISSLKLSFTDFLWKYDILINISIAASTTIEKQELWLIWWEERLISCNCLVVLWGLPTI